MPGEQRLREQVDALRREHESTLREVVTLRKRVADLQRAAARHEETAGISLAEREELLREAERAVHLGTWTWDRESGRVTWSDELYRILGLEPGTLEPSVETFFERVHVEDRERAQSATEQSLRDGVLPLVDCRVVRADGQIRHITASSSMLFDSDGQPRRIVGGVLDRTDGLEVESKLRRTLGLLEEAQALAQLGSWRFDPNRGELEWSREFRRIAGLDPDVTPSIELFMQRVVPEQRANIRAALGEAMEGRAGEADVRLCRPDGEIRLVRVKGFSTTSPNGKPELRGTMVDVTEQVRLREELLHAQKMEAVGRLAGGIAHDFNNLLTVVTANLDLYTQRSGTAPELEASLSALTSAASLTRRLLAFGRKAQLSLRVVALNELVHSTLSLMKRLVGDEVRLEMDLSQDLPQVRIDPLELERALVNLVVNARDVMPAGGVVRIVTAMRRVEGVQQVLLSVEDQGPGIPDAVRPHIFEPFFTTREGDGGTGLGLATVLGTAEQHGGTVEVNPGERVGSVFTIVLPVAEAFLVHESARVESTPGGDESPGRLTLLVIDDEPNVADVTRRMLEVAGHTVHLASLPEEALRIWAEHGASIDLVVCDVAMAHMRGPELVAALEAQLPAPRVLFITGYSEEAVRAELAHPVLAKPFTSASLFRAVEAAACT